MERFGKPPDGASPHAPAISHRQRRRFPAPNFRDRNKSYEGRDKHLRNARAKGTTRFTAGDFEHDEADDTYTCPKGKRLLRKPGTGTSTGGKGRFQKYKIDGDFCEICEFRTRCLSKNSKRRT